MSDYRRWYVPGGTYFFTVITYSRRPILTTELGRQFLHEAIETIQRRRPFTLIATCLLPDHWHLVMQLPSGDADYSTRLKRIKEEFTTHWLAAGLPEAPVTAAQAKNGERGIWQPRFWEHSVRDEFDLERGIWQPRFWEHSVRDEFDLERCVDYVHWNPRKHCLVTRVRDWQWSSFHRFVAAGHYDIDWGGVAPPTIRDCPDNWGEP